MTGPVTFRYETGSEAYPAIMSKLLAHGTRIAPRALPCAELCNVTVHIENASTAVPVSCGRTGFMRVGAAEYMQLLAGVSWLEQLDLATRGKFSELAADSGRLRGAYGPRIYGQLPEAARKLQEDPGTRQAVLSVYRGVMEDAAAGQRDVPCTLNVQYRIRRGKLDATVMMRSSDAWLGIPADWWMQSRLQMTLAWALGVPPGSFTFFAGSLHLYEKDEEQAAGLHWVPDDCEEQPPAIQCNYAEDKPDAAERVRDTQQAALKVVTSRVLNGITNINAQWYKRMMPYPGNLSYLCHTCRYISRDRLCSKCWHNINPNPVVADYIAPVTEILLAEASKERKEERKAADGSKHEGSPSSTAGGP